MRDSDPNGPKRRTIPGNVLMRDSDPNRTFSLDSDPSFGCGEKALHATAKSRAFVEATFFAAATPWSLFIRSSSPAGTSWQ